MRTNPIYIARDGKSGMHVLVRILVVGDIGADYLPIDSDGFNELMMARDARSLVLATQGLGPMFASEGDLAGRIFVPSELQRGIAGEMDLVPSDLGVLLSECYFDPYAEPVGTGGMGYKEVGRTAKKAARELIDEFDFVNAGNLSYLDSQFRAVIEPLHDWIFARNLLSIVLRIGGLYRTGADPKTILETARFRKVEPVSLKERFNMGSATCYAIPIAFNPFYRTENLLVNDVTFDAQKIWPLYNSLTDIKKSFTQAVIDHHLKGNGNEFVKFLTSVEAAQADGRFDNRKNHPEENKWWYLVVSSNIDGKSIDDQMQIANRMLQAVDGRLFQPRIAYSGVKMAEIAPEQKPRNMLEAMWLLVRNHPDHYLLTCKRCMRTVLSGTQGGERSFCSNSCRATWSKEHSAKKR